MFRQYTAYILFPLFLILYTPLHADLKVSKQISIHSFGIELNNTISNEYYRSNMDRVDHTENTHPLFEQINDGPPSSYNITRYDKGVKWFIYDFDSSYGETEMYESEDETDSVSSMEDPEVSDLKDSLHFNYNMVLLPDTIIDNMDCSGMQITARGESGQTEFEIDIWVTQNCEWCQEFINHQENVGLKEDMNPFRSAQFSIMILQSLGLNGDTLVGLANGIQGITVLSRVGMYTSLMPFENHDSIRPTESVAVDSIQPIEPVAGDSISKMENMLVLKEEPIDSVQKEAMEQLIKSFTINENLDRHEMMSITLKIINVSHDALPDSLFEIPAGYKEF